MNLIQIIIVLGIICMMGGAGIIFSSGVKQTPKKRKFNTMVDATPVTYKAHSINQSSGLIEMVPVKTKRIDHKSK